MARRESKTVGASDRRRRQSDELFSTKKRIPIDQLLAYWIDLSKRSTLTLDDYRKFIAMAKETNQYFRENYGHIERDKFLRFIPILISWPQNYFKEVYETQQLADSEYALIKDVAKKFIARIKKYFGQRLVLSRSEKTPLQDAEDLLSSSTKLTFRWAAGIIASNHIAALLIRLSNFPKGQKFNDDIDTLYENLKKRTKNPKLKRFLIRSHRRFEDADKTRNRCAHVNEGEPTRQEIEQSISLARLLQRFR
jgi:hypothetical protein